MGMLSLKSRMDRIGKPTDPFIASPNLIRQPSAEDLDAAHQLVSSARGGRNGLAGIEETFRIGDPHGPFLDGGSTDLLVGTSTSGAQSVLSGQTCRSE